MMTLPLNRLPALGRSCLLLGCLAFLDPPVFAEDWSPIAPEQLAAETSQVEPDADAEAIFWEMRLDDDVNNYGEPHTVISHSVRIKVYNERGRDAQSRFDIPFIKGTRVYQIEGRTIRPDGSVVKLKEQDIHEKTLFKLSGLKLQAKTFTLPAVEPGCVLDVRWRQRNEGQLTNYVRVPLQREIPVQRLQLWIRPLVISGFPYGMRTRSFHGNVPAFTKEKDGFFTTTLRNVKAFQEEPMMPPEDVVRHWLLVYYSEDTGLGPDKFWDAFGKQVHEYHKDDMKPGKEVKKLVQQTLGDASTPEQKLERLLQACRAKVKYAWDSDSGLTEEQSMKLKLSKSPDDTLKKGVGHATDLNRLFAAMATAAGFEARMALVTDRGDLFFDRDFADPFMLSDPVVAVKTGQDWHFFDPARTLIPSGMLRWRQEGIEALVCDEKDSLFVKTPLSKPDRSRIQRKADLTLAADGTLSGKVELELMGHPGIEQRYENQDLSDSERETALKDDLKTRLATAEVSEVKFENLKDIHQPLRVSYSIRIPSYASRTGKRLFLKPALFQNGKSALFVNQSREHEIYFQYPWSEKDQVTIALPAGFQADSTEQPVPFTVPNLGRYEVKVNVSPDGSRLEYQRSFEFSGLLFPQNAYEALKKVFDTLHQRDNQTIALKLNTEAGK